ncbi:MAG: heparin lyase I family protein [Deltaproteobacteria bacterium]|nr:heparin lyase I family protein [Deltaproteobacteria bacterium]
MTLRRSLTLTVAAVTIWSAAPARAQQDGSTTGKFEIDADGGETIQSDGEIQNEKGLVSGCFQSSDNGTLPPFWEKKSSNVYKGSSAYKVVMQSPAHYRNEQKPIQSWHRDDGERYFRFALANGDTMGNPSSHAILTQWWQSGTSPPVALQIYGDRHPRLVTKDDYGSATAANFRYTTRWTDTGTVTNGTWHSYIVKIKWGAGNGELKLWKWVNGSWQLKYDSNTHTGMTAPNYIGYHDAGMDQTNYTWKIGGYRGHNDPAKYTMYFDEMRYAKTWDSVRVNE